MLKAETSYSFISGITKFRFRRVVHIAVFWTLIDLISTVLNFNTHDNHTKSILVRALLVFCMSLIMGYLFVFTLKSVFRKSSIAVNFVAKTLILLVAALIMNFLVNFVDHYFISGDTVSESVDIFYGNILDHNWLLKRTLYWMILFAITQLYLEINDKYSPGVFVDILLGKYIQPKNENRIIMFIDLKDSTPIAEKLGHEHYFLFIREFIYHISLALIEHGGIIYQYVGDEVVVSWKYSRKNIRQCLGSIILARRNIQRHSERFRRSYGIIPEFRVGMHVGDVTVGEIGIIKKDLAMSGDTMNTTARIRSACNELNQQFIVSKEFAEKTSLKNFQLESLGIVELKGKATGIELFALKI
jgi:adenylate cyclase